MATTAELEAALATAVAQQFGELFRVLYLASDPPEALKRFERGLQKLLDTEFAVAQVIHQVEDTT
jgi:hypothetical protein